MKEKLLSRIICNVYNTFQKYAKELKKKKGKIHYLPLEKKPKQTKNKQIWSVKISSCS